MVGQAFVIGREPRGRVGKTLPNTLLIHLVINSSNYYVLRVYATHWAGLLGYINDTVFSHKELTV